MNRTLFKVVLGISACVFLLMLSVASAPPAEAAANWYNDNWTYRQEITISQSFVENEDFDNFPVLIVMDLDNAKTQDDGDDILFTASDGSTKLNHEIENFSTENLVAWVQIPTLTYNSDTIIFCYYGNDSVANQESVENVWDDNYMMVQHMYDTTTSTTTDSTSNNNDGTKTGANEPLENIGKIFNAQSFDDVDDVITISDSATTSGPEELTISFWMKSGEADGFTMSKYADGQAEWFVQVTVSEINVQLYDQSATTATILRTSDASGVVVDGNWHHVVVTWDGGASPLNIKIYVDGDNFDTGVGSGGTFANIDDGTADLTIGRFATTYYDNYLDEVRMSNVARNANYIRTSFLIQDAPGNAITVGAEEEFSPIVVDGILSDNILLDNHVDWATSGVVTTAQLQVDVVFTETNSMVVKENVYFGIYDGSNTLIDNIQAVDNLWIADNEQRFYAPFDSEDNSFAGTELGFFDVTVWAADNISHVSSTIDTETFSVDEVTATSNVENRPGHRIRTYGTASRVSADPLTNLENVIIIDNTMGTFDAVLDGVTWENIRTPATGEVGEFYLRVKSENLDGEVDNVVTSYLYPNLVAGLVSVHVDNALIDNHRSDNSITATQIEAVLEDNDGFTDFNDNFWIGLRDAADTLILLENVSSTVTFENENRVVLVLTYDAEDNTGLVDAGMGAWDIWTHADDNWSDNSVWTASAFTVNEMTVTIDFTPVNPDAGWDLTVSGTSSLRSGTASVENHRIVDAVHGTFWKENGNAYSENYDILISGPGDIVLVTVTTYDGVLDGENSASYTVSDNQKFEVSIRYEENYGLIDENLDARPITLDFEWDGGSYHYVLTSNPENITVSVGGNPVNIVQVTDNDAYWRRNVLEVFGGRVTMIIVGDPGTVGGTSTGDVDEFFFFLQDLTGLFEPPNGIMSFRRWIGENLAVVHKDLWGADWKMVAWLVTGSRYQVWMEAENAALRLIGPMDAVNPSVEKTIQVKPVVSEAVVIFEDVGYAAYRVSDNVIRVEYQDNLSETTAALVTIKSYAGTILQVYQPDNDWFIITYSLADPDFGYTVDLNVVHTTYGTVELSTTISSELPEGPGGTSDVFNFPDGVTLASLGSFILMMVMALAFDATRVPMGILSMVMVAIFCWRMGWLILPGPFDGAFTATMFLVAAAIVILTWRFRR